MCVCVCVCVCVKNKLAYYDDKTISSDRLCSAGNLDVIFDRQLALKEQTSDLPGDKAHGFSQTVSLF